MATPAPMDQVQKEINAWRHVFESQREHVGRLQKNRIIPESYIEEEMRRMRSLYAHLKSLETTHRNVC